MSLPSLKSPIFSLLFFLSRLIRHSSLLACNCGCQSVWTHSGLPHPQCISTSPRIYSSESRCSNRVTCSENKAPNPGKTRMTSTSLPASKGETRARLPRLKGGNYTHVPPFAKGLSSIHCCREAYGDTEAIYLSAIDGLVIAPFCQIYAGFIVQAVTR